MQPSIGSGMPVSASSITDGGERIGDSVQSLLTSARQRLEAGGADSPWLTALVLLEHVTGLPRAALLAHPERGVSVPEAARFKALVDRRAAREPVAYILGYRDFYGRRFAVSPETLIPRPETEGLVDLAIDRLDQTPNLTGFPVLDVATGSGAIVESILAARDVAAVATDSSVAALTLARDNARALHVSERLRLIACDLASALRTRFPVVVANLPYVPSVEIEALQPEIATYEPRSALDGGPDGTIAIRGLLASLPDVLAPGGTALLEIGEGQADPLGQFARSALPGYGVATQCDHAGTARFLVIERPDR
jgi:release factor glutamine methyltransferase